MTRKEANDEILSLLGEYLEHAEDQRFGQALVNIGILINLGKEVKDPFYEEPQDTLERVMYNLGRR